MQITPHARLMRYGQLLQETLFGVLEAVTGPLSERARLLVAVLEMIPLSRQLPCARGWLWAARPNTGMNWRRSSPKPCTGWRPPANCSTVFTQTGNCVCCAAGQR